METQGRREDNDRWEDCGGSADRLSVFLELASSRCMDIVICLNDLWLFNEQNRNIKHWKRCAWRFDSCTIRIIIAFATFTIATINLDEINTEEPAKGRSTNNGCMLRQKKKKNGNSENKQTEKKQNPVQNE